MVRRAGYTLVEAMITVAIIGIVASLGARLLTNTQQFISQGTARAAVQRDARAALDLMNRTLRLASASSIIVAQDIGQPPYSKVNFVAPDGSSVTFTLNGRKLVRVSGTQTAVLADDIEYLAFTFPRTDDNTILSIAMTMRKRNSFGRDALLQTTISKVRVMNP